MTERLVIAGSRLPQELAQQGKAAQVAGMVSELRQPNAEVRAQMFLAAMQVL